MFSTINRIKNHPKSRPSVEHADEQIRNSCHLPKNTKFVNWEKVHSLFKSKKRRLLPEFDSESKRCKKAKTLTKYLLLLLQIIHLKTFILPNRNQYMDTIKFKMYIYLQKKNHSLLKPKSIVHKYFLLHAQHYVHDMYCINFVQNNCRFR